MKNNTAATLAVRLLRSLVTASLQSSSKYQTKWTIRGLAILSLLALIVVGHRLIPHSSALTDGGVISTLDTPLTESFDTLPASGSAIWTNNSTIPGWYHARTGTGTTIVANDGGSNAGNLYSYGTGTNTDRALGSVGSGNTAAGNFFWGVRLQNNTGATITSLDVSYVGEQWRNSAAAAQTIAFSYLVGSPSVTGSLSEFQSAGVPVVALDFTSPVTGGTAGALNGNLAANRVAISSSITGLNVPNGTEIMLRWSDPDHTGSDHGLAIDDFSVTAHSAPTPTPPTGLGAANPNVVAPGGNTLLTVTVTPGSNPTSTGLAVTADLTAINGSATQQFFDDQTHGDVTPNDNIFTFSATVDAGTTPGAKSLPFTITDGQGRTSPAASIALIVQPENIPPGSIVISQVYGGGGNTGATFKNDFIELFNRTSSTINIDGWSVQYASSGGSSWQVTNLSGTISPGKYYLVQEAAGAGGTIALPTPDATGGIPMSATAGKVALVTNTTALTVSCPLPNASIIDFVGYGASATCSEGGNPTSNASNTTAELRIVDGCIDTDNNGADFTTGPPNPRNSASPFKDCTVAIPTLTINQIQGNGSASPYANQLVQTTFAIVTGLKNNGFYIQTPDGADDADPATSEGVFVFTSSGPGVSIGNGVTVRGRVQEFIPSADPNSPPVTELGAPLTITVLSTGNPLPAPITLTAADTSPSGSIEQLEKFEGMRVHVASLTAIAPTQGTINEATATSVSNGVFYGVITGVARPFREPGVEVPDPLPPSSPCCVPRFDANPERLRVDSDAQPGSPILDVTTGAVITNLTGPLDYSFRTYTILPDAATPASVSGNINAIPVPVPGDNQFTVASFNMERFFDTTNDPEQDVALTATAFNNRLNKASLAIRNVMRSPDIIGVEEMEHLSTLQAVATKVNNDAVAAGQPNPNYQAYLEEGNDIGGIDSGFLVKGSRVTVVSVTQEGKDATYIDPNNGEPALLNDRPPLILEATIQPPSGSPLPVTVIVNHLRSLSGVDDPSDGNRVRTKRRAQAEFLANLIQARQSANPNERIISVGDYNAFQFNDGYVDVIGTVKGTPTSSDQVVLSSSDLVNPDLTDLVDLAPADQRYSFSFDGNAQELDHILITHNVMEIFSALNYARNDADFPESFRGDSTRPERISDHDMPVAYFVFPEANLSISKTAPASVETGSQFSYTVTVNNPSAFSATDVVVTDTLPAQVSFVSCSSTASGVCGGSGNSRTVSFSSLAAGASAVITFNATLSCAVADAASIDNTAGVTSSTTDPVLDNNSASAAITASNPSPTLSCPTNITVGNDSGLCSAVVSYDVPSATDNCSGAMVVCSPAPGSVFAKGTTQVTCTATDLGGATASCSFNVTVNDTESPVISGESATPSLLTPPNHKMVNVTVSYTATDNCGSVTNELTVTSNEPINGTGDGDSAPDWIVVDSQHVQLRAERAGTGTGRIYTITIKSTDSSGNFSTKTVQVSVPLL